MNEVMRDEFSSQEFFVKVIPFDNVSAQVALPYVRRVLTPVQGACISFVDLDPHGALFILVPKENRTEITSAIESLDVAALRPLVENSVYLPVIPSRLEKEELLSAIQSLFVIPTDMTFAGIEVTPGSGTVVVVSGPEERSTYFREIVLPRMKSLITHFESLLAEGAPKAATRPALEGVDNAEEDR